MCFSFNNELFKQINKRLSNGWLVIGSLCRYLYGKNEGGDSKTVQSTFLQDADDIITKRSVGKVDYLYSKLNNYHPNVKLPTPKSF